MKKTLSLMLSAIIMLTSVILPLSAMAADTMTAETNVITSSPWYNISYTHGDAHINMEFQNVDKDGKIHINKGEAATVIVNSGAYAQNSDNRLNEISWHYRKSADSDGITTDIIWSGKTEGWKSVKVEGFGASNIGSPSEQTRVNSTTPITTTFTSEVYNNVGEYALSISYKYQMKYQEWFSFKTGKETAASASTVNFTIVVDDNAAPVHQHTYDKNVTAPTCTADGYTTYTCNNSDGLGTKGDDSYVSDETNKLDHDFNGELISNHNGTHKTECTRFNDCKTYGSDEQCKYQYSVIIPATETSTGLGRYACECGYSYDEPIAVITCSHNGSKHTENQKNATCTDKGYSGDTVCDVCANVIEVGSEIPAKNHNWDNGTVTTPATCTAEGVKTFTCKNDSSHKRTETVAKTAHTEKTRSENEVKGNCITAGSYDKITYCSVCNTILKTEKITTSVDKNNHTGKTSVINEKTATCAENGYTGDTICADCKTVVKAGTVIDKSTIAHTNGAAVKDNEIAGTCVKEGSYDSVVYCIVCNAEISRETVAASKNKDNHSGETEIKGYVAPTQEESGYTGDTCCKDCGTVLEKGSQIDKLPDEKPSEPATEEPVKPTDPTDPTDPAEPSEKPTESSTESTATQKNDEKTTTEKNTATSANKDNTVKNNSKTSPKTGADADMSIMITVVVFTAAMFIFVVVKKKKLVK